MTDHDMQREYWNGQSGRYWADHQDAMDRTLGEISAALMQFAGAAAGQRVLDIGCGCGTTTFQLASTVGATGRVVGVDISAPMLSVARARNVLPNVEFVEADASSRAFEPSTDLIFSRFGVMFFADPQAAFRTLHTALAPGGRMAFVCWQAMADNAWAADPLQSAVHLLRPPQLPEPTAPGPFAFADRDRTASMLEHAGFDDVTIEPLASMMILGAHLEDATEAALSFGPLARALADADDGVRSKARQAVSALLGRYATPEGVKAPAACWLVAATR